VVPALGADLIEGRARPLPTLVHARAIWRALQIAASNSSLS
jgi:hypothetical protein